ncbi:MAG TPA: nitroreductase family protein [Terriglobales bacterium]|nr:nitroreductase family protein [Terriglobales bacterium]
MDIVLHAILQRRAIRAFEPVEIPPELRQELFNAARSAPSSFNLQPYRFYWVESPGMRKIASRLCLGQRPAETASALIVAVADIGSWQRTTQGQLEWMRHAGVGQDKVAEYENKARWVKWFFVQGWFGILGSLKWFILRLLNLWKPIGMPPVTRQGLFKWATKNTALACENLMIAAEALGLHTCPMEGIDARRLAKLLGLSSRYHEIVMVIAIGEKSPSHVSQPQWRRPLEATVTVL